MRAADYDSSGGCLSGGSVGVIECDLSGTRFYDLRAYELAWHARYDQICLRQLSTRPTVELGDRVPSPSPSPGCSEAPHPHRPRLL